MGGVLNITICPPEITASDSKIYSGILIQRGVKRKRQQMSKAKIKKYLVEKEVYHDGYDFLLSMLSDQIALYKEVRATIKKEGLSVSGDAEGNFKVRNQHFKTLQELTISITKLSEKLGVSVKDSAIIKELVGEPEDDDGMDDDEV
jgi:phage terminase small subunit